MKYLIKCHIIRYVFIFSAFMMMDSCTTENLQIGTIAIIPKPLELSESEGYFVINSATTVGVQNEGQKVIAEFFFKSFESVSGWSPKILEGVGDIQFEQDDNLEEEAYSMQVTKEGVAIKASSGAGFFYALQSLKQLLPVSFYSGKRQDNVAWGIPAVTINDQPAFEWRGYMLDVSRHFFEIEDVKKVIDFMAELKMNRFHWHLTDDQGWRLEIKSYPKLTEVGAWRMDYTNYDETISNWFGRPVQQPGETPTYGGFYTQEQVKDLIAYAKERFIEVIPEIDMPGHAQATIAAYPELGCVNASSYVATGGVSGNNTYNPGKDETFVFIEKMLNEVMDLFPYEYIHIGGDECNKSQWKVDPHAQQRMREEGLANVEELQSYFIKRVENILNEHDKIMIGWDEILEGGLAPNATVMSWRGEEGGIVSAKAGHEVIMTPSNYTYVDLKQGHDDLEPNLGYSELLLSTAYNYQVIPDALTKYEGRLIKGIQANMWTESISDWSKLTYMTFPRLYAISETGWTDHEAKDWDGFTDRLQTQFKRLDAQKVRYATSAFSPWIDHKGIGKEIEISLKTEVNGLDIHYTLDGLEPTLQSPKYEGPFKIKEGEFVTAQSFQNREPIGYVASLNFPIHKAAGLGRGSKAFEKLTDLNYGKLTDLDPNWVHFHGEMDINFETPTELSELRLTALRMTILGIYPPEVVEVYGSSDGKTFTKLAETDQTNTSHIQGRNKISTTVTFAPSKVKAVRIKAKAVNPIPEGHHRAGAQSRIWVDEVQLY
ncbi:family 20 glycosylhydrolase [Ulvibacterium sp.]|uniref:beta-N-acetylhexosaminidase n=1 Tax=Ulvibacterium sp. TaxID=2665914 RepID=UPI0026271F01|nr:family 20 glycosylhydrolase [Ulvibacterium sp.]